MSGFAAQEQCVGRAAVRADWSGVIERARLLEAGAFDEIVDAYTDRLFGFFHRMIGTRNEAEDLVQEVFVRVVRTIREYHDEGRFESWLFKIAGNLARDRLRRRPEPAGIESDDESCIKAQVGDGRSDPHAMGGRLERAEQSDRLQALLQRLPSVEREVVLMRHFGEMSFQEIAEYTGCPMGTVLSRAHRGLSKLRGWMESQA
jgi:RNA polymerase sigma-70 factor (ECF subfamily)